MVTHISGEPLRLDAAIVEDAWCAAWRSLAYDGVTHVEETPHLLRILTPSSSELLLNAVLRYHQDRPVQERDIQQILQPYRLAHRPMQWWLRPDVAPAGLRDRLRGIGMVTWDHPPGMVLRLHGWLPPSRSSAIQVRPIATSAEAETVLAMICEVFGTVPASMRRWCINNPAFVVYLAWVRGQPAAALAYHLEAGVAGFFHVATLPQWRRRGVAWNLMIQALLDVQRAGAQAAALTASSMAQDLYRALGFVACGQFEFWMPGPRLLEDLTDFR